MVSRFHSAEILSGSCLTQLAKSDSKTHIFYVPGLGDHRPTGQRQVIRLWRLHGVNAHFYPMHWSDQRSFAAKLEAFLAAIDYELNQGHRVSLVGASAGASAVINAFAARKDRLHRVVCISGKLHNPESIAHTFASHPSFAESLAFLPANIERLHSTDRSRILSLHPWRDSMVPVPDTRIDGANEGTLPIIGHVLSIAYAITIGSARIAKYLKS